MTSSVPQNGMKALVVTVAVFLALSLVAIVVFSPDGFRFAEAPAVSAVALEAEVKTEDADFDRRMLAEAEHQYQRNLAARSDLFPGMECVPKVPGHLCDEITFKMAFLAPTWSCPREVHVGRWGEAGKWLCAVPRAFRGEQTVVYSVGSDGEMSFEEAMLQVYNIYSHTFDPTLKPEPFRRVSAADCLTFYNIGVVGADDVQAEYAKFSYLAEGAQLMQMGSILTMLNHTYVDILKMDCEGCEEGFIDYMARTYERSKPVFGQLLVEFHRLQITDLAHKMLTTLENLGYRSFHWEPNFWDPAGCWEVAFIHESLLQA